MCTSNLSSPVLVIHSFIYSLFSIISIESLVLPLDHQTTCLLCINSGILVDHRQDYGFTYSVTSRCRTGELSTQSAANYLRLQPHTSALVAQFSTSANKQTSVLTSPQHPTRITYHEHTTNIAPKRILPSHHPTIHYCAVPRLPDIAFDR